MLTSIDPSMLSSSSIVAFRVVQLRKYSRNSRCRPSSCLLAVLAMFLAIFRLVLTLETSEMSAIFQVHNQNNSTSFPGLLG